MNRLILDPINFFNDLGDLHDAHINSMTWDAAAKSITIMVNDLNSNFQGLPEYKGKEQAYVLFIEVENLLFNCDALGGDTQRIYALEMQKKADSEKYECMMRIFPSGRLSFDCCSVEVASTAG